MNNFYRFAGSAFVISAALCASEREAHAIGPVDVEIGARVGFATNPDSKGPNPFGLGVGGRGGVSIFGFYGGLSAIHYFGSSKDIPVPPLGTVNLSFSSTLIGAELGYSITAIPKLVIRPQLGIGSASFSFGDQSTSNLYLEPGATVLVVLGLFYFGADANLLLIPGVEQGQNESTTYTAVTIHGQVGVRF